MPNKLTDKLSNNSPILSNGLSDTEIKKALEKLYNTSITATATDFEVLNAKGLRRFGFFIKEVIDLINRDEAENTELLEKIKKLQDEYRWLDQESDILAADVNTLNHFLETAKAEAYKRCIENAKEELYEWVGADDSIPYTRIKRVLDNLLKEMGVK